MDVKIKTNAKDVAKRIGKEGKELKASFKRALSITAQAGIIRTQESSGRALNSISIANRE